MNRKTNKIKTDWLKAEQEYLSNTQLSLADIALEYNVSYSRLKKISMEKGWHQKRLRLIEKGRNSIENEAEKSITEQVKQHRKEVIFVKNLIIEEIKNRISEGRLKNERLTSLTRLLDLCWRERRELFPKNSIIEEKTAEPKGTSTALTEAVYDVFIYKLGRKRPSVHFNEARTKRWQQNIKDYKNYKWSQKRKVTDSKKNVNI